MNHNQTVLNRTIRKGQTSYFNNEVLFSLSLCIIIGICWYS